MTLLSNSELLLQILGAGYIAVELAGVFHALGTPEPLPHCMLYVCDDDIPLNKSSNLNPPPYF